jgi:predicted ATP-dependent endonuclease of OLD family
MYISALRVSNFRRLRDVLIDLDEYISIFVGPNNSGSTSSANVLQFFLKAEDKITVHDFHSASWAEMNAFGEVVAGAILPRISIDIWFKVKTNDLHRVIDLLPRLQWQGTEVGVRIDFVANDELALRNRFIESRDKARQHVRKNEQGAIVFHPKPKDMYEYLTENLGDEYGFKFYVLYRSRFSGSYVQDAGYEPGLMTPEKGQCGREVLNSLVRIDLLNAQRWQGDWFYRSRGGRVLCTARPGSLSLSSHSSRP